MVKFRSYALYCAWVLAGVGTLSSIYYSYLMNIEPCSLCYYQRICLFPLTLILGIATYRGDTSIKRYTLPLSLGGCVIAIYQVCLQEIPGMAIDICGRISCTNKLFILGPVTIPMASAVTFCVISILLAIAKPEK